MKKYLLQSTLVIFLLALTGCARFAVPPVSTTYQPNLSWPQRQAQLSAIQSWKLKSVLSIQQQKQVSFVSLNWQQQGDHFQQQITGPLGLGGVRISGVPGQVTLWKSETEKNFSANSRTITTASFSMAITDFESLLLGAWYSSTAKSGARNIRQIPSLSCTDSRWLDG